MQQDVEMPGVSYVRWSKVLHAHAALMLPHFGMLLREYMKIQKLLGQLLANH